DDGGVNVEMIWDREADRIWILEVNPRASSQFADLIEKVDGVNTYSLLVDIALGRPIHRPARGGRYACAASCVLRRFTDARVVSTPAADDLKRIAREDPDARVEVLATAGTRLSGELQ